MQVKVVRQGDKNIVNITTPHDEMISIISEINPDYDVSKFAKVEEFINSFEVDAIATWGELLAEQDQEQLIKYIMYVTIVGYDNDEHDRTPFYYAYEALRDSLSEAKSNDIVSLMALSPMSQAASGVPSGISKCRSMLGLPAQPNTISTMSVRSKRSVSNTQIDLSALSDYSDTIDDVRSQFLKSFVPMEVNEDG